MLKLQKCGPVLRLSLALLGVVLVCGQVAGQPLTEQFGDGANDANRVVSVEEDWELVVVTPDSRVNAPQVTCVISPVGHADGIHAAFNINHQTLPSYVAGGLQLQLWNGEYAVRSRRFPADQVMSTDSETVRWTQSVELTNGQLQFEVTNGTSGTWNTFGGQGYLRLAAETAYTSLNYYNPQVSVNNSGVAYAGNRVSSLMLKRIRATTADGEVHEIDLNLVKQLDR